MLQIYASSIMIATRTASWTCTNETQSFVKSKNIILGSIMHRRFQFVHPIMLLFM